MTRVEQIDLSPVLRLRGLLSWTRNLGFVAGSLLLVLSIADRRLLLLVAVIFAASVWLPRGSPAAAIALVLTAAAAAGYFEWQYRLATARHAARPAVESGDPRVERAMGALVETDRSIARLWLALSGLYLAVLVPTALYRRRAPRPRPGLAWHRRLALRASFLRVRATPRAILFFILAVACALVALAPALVVVLGLLLQVPHTAGTAPIIEWAFDYDWPKLATTLAGVIGCLFFLARAKRHAALSVRRVRALDPRPPILLLRSFADDTTPLERNRDQHSWARSVVVPTVWTLEETIEQVLGGYGPVIAIGRPGEALPPAGAAREYLAHDAWQGRVRELIGQARLVVVVLGASEGLRFEYRTLRELGARPKLVLLVPPRSAETLELGWRRFCDVFAPAAAAPEIDLARALAVRFAAGGAPSVVTAHRRDDEDCYRLALERCLVAVPR